MVDLGAVIKRGCVVRTRNAGEEPSHRGSVLGSVFGVLLFFVVEERDVEVGIERGCWGDNGLRWVGWPMLGRV